MSRTRKPRPGRPSLPPGEATGRVLSVRLTARERRAVEEVARQAGETASGWAREAILQAILVRSNARP